MTLEDLIIENNAILKVLLKENATILSLVKSISDTIDDIQNPHFKNSENGRKLIIQKKQLKEMILKKDIEYSFLQFEQNKITIENNLNK